MKSLSDIEKLQLTPLAIAANMPALYEGLEREKQIARRVVQFQMLSALLAFVISYYAFESITVAISLFCGATVSLVNGTLLAFRMTGSDKAKKQYCLDFNDAGLQLRKLYFFAVERFIVVVTLLSLCMVILKVTALAVLSGFVLGQVTLFTAQILLSRFK